MLHAGSVGERAGQNGATRRARLAVTTVFALNGALFANWVARVPAVKDGIGAGTGALGLALLGLAVGSLFTMPFAGRLCERLGSGRVVVITGLASSAALTGPALASSALTLGLALVVYGAAFGVLDVAMNVQAVAVVRRVGRPIMPHFHAAFSLGGLVGAATGALAAQAGLAVPAHFTLTGTVAGGAVLATRRHLLPDDSTPATSATSAAAPVGPGAATVGSGAAAAASVGSGAAAMTGPVGSAAAPVGSGAAAVTGPVGSVGAPVGSGDAAGVAPVGSGAAAVAPVGSGAAAVAPVGSAGTPVASGAATVASADATAAAPVGSVGAPVGSGAASAGAPAAFAGVTVVTSREQPRRSDLRRWDQRRVLLAGLGVLAGCAALGEGAMADWTALFLRDVTGAGAGAAALGFAAFSITMTLGRLGGEAAISRLGPVRVLRLGGIAVATGIVLAVATASPVAGLVGFGLVGAGFSCAFPLALTTAGESSDGTGGSEIASVSVIAYLGFLVGPPLIGLLAEVVDLRWAMLALVLPAVGLIALSPAVASTDPAEA